MTQLLHLAAATDLERLVSMVAACHAQRGIETDETHRRAALLPLLEGSPHGAVWLIGPRIAPVGYLCVSFGWSLEQGGMAGFLNEMWIREKIRGRGMGSEALTALQVSLAEAGVLSLDVDVADGSDGAARLFRRAGFRDRGTSLMTWAP